MSVISKKGTKKKKTTKKLTKTDTDSSLCGRKRKYDYTHYLFDGGNGEGEYEYELPEMASRTSLLIHDYKRFKAARTIQTVARGWFTRYRLQKATRAAIVIQTNWRVFYAKRYYYCLLEKTLQAAIDKHFEDAATKIQSLWRGWWVREHIHDQSRLARMQTYAAEDLLYCVAFKLHHLMRTYAIPGIYSLKNSNCLSRVEKLLSSMSFKQHNQRARMARMRRMQELAEARKTFHTSAHATCIPYSGPNIFGFCDPMCEKLYMEADPDSKMNRILEIYEDEGTRDPLVNTLKKHKMSKQLKQTLRKATKPSDFCRDVIKSMKRWNILNTKNLKIPHDIFKTPENVENFLNDAQSILNLMEERCACKYRNTRRICDTPEEKLCE